MKIASTSKCKQKHGAVLIKGGRVLAVGYNIMKNDPGSLGFLPESLSEVLSVHAEVDALRQVHDARGATMFVARISKKGEPALSKPCERCSRKLAKAGIKRVCYTVNEG